MCVIADDDSFVFLLLCAVTLQGSNLITRCHYLPVQALVLHLEVSYYGCRIGLTDHAVELVLKRVVLQLKLVIQVHPLQAVIWSMTRYGKEMCMGCSTTAARPAAQAAYPCMAGMHTLCNFQITKESL